MSELSLPGLGFVTFTSDFGWSWGYVAVCEGIILRVTPQAKVYHLSHDVPAGDVAAGALILQRIIPVYPPAVHLAVVDPGVGTARRPVVVHAKRGDFLVGPDNGLLLPAADALGGMTDAWLLEATAVRELAGLPPERVSSTFHGRDLFSPAAALLARGVAPDSLGTPVPTNTLVRLDPPHVAVDDQGLTAQVIEVDRFGNVGLALPFAELQTGAELYRVELPGEDLPAWTARVVATFAELGSGELGIYCDSWGQVALALKSASAAQLLSLERGMLVRLTPLLP